MLKANTDERSGLLFSRKISKAGEGNFLQK
jgi:hypothetical protein